MFKMMINKILQDSLVVNQSEKYHLTHLSISEAEDFILNCNEFDKIKFVIEQNKTTFKVTGKAYDRLVKFVKENENKTNWVYISYKQKLSKVNWNWISFYQKLSEEFIRDFQDKVNWAYISFYQTLSEDFIREFQDKVDWYWIFRKQILSEEFRKEFAYKLK